MPVLATNGVVHRPRQSLARPLPGYTAHTLPLLIILAFCRSDAWLAIKNLRWMRELEPTGLQYDCLLAADEHAPMELVAAEAATLFRSLDTFIYPPPKPPVTWPAGNNWMFTNVARRIAVVERRPWLLIETDSVPVRAGWADALQEEYRRAGKPFMGPTHNVLRPHMNGQAIYPPDVAEFAPSAFAPPPPQAWDTAMAAEAMPHTHAANHLMQNAWTVDADNRYDLTDRHKPTFNTQADVNALLEPEAVFFHPTKDGTLIDRLRERGRDALPARPPGGGPC